MSSVLKYRPEIDGLRAIAVLSVILFHMHASWLPGGFVGVDIFFVISGFLITSIMVREVHQGTFTFAHFYVRRIKRILPPLYVMLLISWLAGFLFLIPSDYQFFLSSLEKVLIFLANEFFLNSGDYFSPLANELPLLHTWSLAVEEQFYFVWPALFLGLSKIPKKWTVPILVGLMVMSFAAAEIALANLHPSFAYYSLATRGGELLIGALLGILLAEKRFVNVSRTGAEVLGIVGTILMFVSFFVLSEKVSFPGINSLYPTIGAALLILATAIGARTMEKVYSLPILVHFGKLSYSLYLWHWPILAYMRYLKGSYELPTNWLFLMALLTYGCSVLSYYFIENRVRTLKLNFAKAASLYCLLPALFLAGFGALGSKPIFSFRQKPNIEHVSYGGDELCHGRTNQNCTRGDKALPAKILVIGDSHAAHYNYFFDELGKKNAFSVEVRSASSCGPVIGFDKDILPEWARKPCADLLDYFVNNFEKFETIVIAARWDYQLGLFPEQKSDPQFLAKLENTLKMLSGKGKKIVVLSQIPLLSVNPYRFERARNFNLPVDVQYSNSSTEANNQIRSLIAEIPGVRWVDTAKLIAEKSWRPNGDSIYMDNNHLSQFGAKILAQEFSRAGFSL